MGLLFQVVGALGVVITLLGMLVLPFAASRAAAMIQEALISTAGSARTAAKSLQLAGDSLGEAARTLGDVDAGIVAADGSLESIKQFLRTTADVAGDDVPTTVEAARRALLSAEDGALAIDQVLRTLASIGWLTGVDYAPQQSLDAGLGSVAAELEPLPESLRELEGDLNAAADGIEPVQSSLQTVSGDLDSFSASLIALQEQTYDQATDLRTQAVALILASDDVPVWIWAAAVAIELIAIGRVVEQCAVFFVGRLLWGDEDW
jgi:hypothetical protein